MTSTFTRLLITIGLGLHALGLAGLVRHLNRRRLKVLLYHACEEREDTFLLGLDSNTTPADFAMHLGLEFDSVISVSGWCGCTSPIPGFRVWHYSGVV